MFSKSYQLLIISLIGWPLILMGTVILGLSWPEYRFVDHTVSVLASVIAPTRIAMSTIFVIDGFLLGIYGKKLNEVLGNNFRQFGTGHVLMLSGIFLALLAFFPGGENLGIEVATQTAHTIIAVLLVMSFITAPVFFVLKLRHSKEWKLTIVITIVLTALKVLNYLGSVLVVFFVGQFAGLLQKLGLALDGAWMIYISFQLIRLKIPFNRSISV